MLLHALAQAVPTPSLPPALPPHPPLVVAAVLVALLGLAHSVLGERYILRRLFRRDLPHLFGGPGFTRDTLRFAWHLLTLAWWALAGIILLLAEGGGPARAERPIGWVLAASFLIFGLVTAMVSRGRHLSWVVHLVVAGLVVFGMGD